MLITKAEFFQSLTCSLPFDVSPNTQGIKTVSPSLLTLAEMRFWLTLCTQTTAFSSYQEPPTPWLSFHHSLWGSCPLEQGHLLRRQPVFKQLSLWTTRARKGSINHRILDVNGFGSQGCTVIGKRRTGQNVNPKVTKSKRWSNSWRLCISLSRKTRVGLERRLSS